MARAKKQIKSDDFKGAKTFAEISATGEAEVDVSQIEVVPLESAAAVIEDEAFMNEVVEIMIDADEDPNAPVFLQTGHNGIDQYIQRGVPQRIKRKFLYSLVAAKRTQFACAFGKDNGGNEFNRMQGRTNTTHRLNVLDDTPKGRAAFARWMQSPA